MNKPILCLDFDGVVHRYESKWEGPTEIPDPPVEGFYDFIKEVHPYFTISIFSSRSHQEGGINAMRGWLLQNAPDNLEITFILNQLQFPKEKPPAMVTLDDRAITFRGTWPEVSELRRFKPWNRK